MNLFRILPISNFLLVFDIALSSAISCLLKVTDYFQNIQHLLHNSQYMKMNCLFSTQINVFFCDSSPHFRLQPSKLYTSGLLSGTLSKNAVTLCSVRPFCKVVSVLHKLCVICFAYKCCLYMSWMSTNLACSLTLFRNFLSHIIFSQLFRCLHQISQYHFAIVCTVLFRHETS